MRAQMDLINRFRKQIMAVFLLVIVLVVAGLVWNMRFHITGTTPTASQFNFITPFVDVNFNKALNPKEISIESSSIIKAYAVVQPKSLRIYLHEPLAINQSFTIVISSVESLSNSKLDNKKITLVANKVNFNLLTPAEQKVLIEDQSQYPPQVKDPILSHLPYGTLDYNLSASYKTINGKAQLILSAQILLDAEDISSAQTEQAAISTYEQQVSQYISSLGLNPSNYDIQYAIVQPST